MALWKHHKPRDDSWVGPGLEQPGRTSTLLWSCENMMCRRGYTSSRQSWWSNYQPTFGVEHLFELQEHVGKPAHVADQLHDVVRVCCGGVGAVGALADPGRSSRTRAGAGEPRAQRGFGSTDTTAARSSTRTLAQHRRQHAFWVPWAPGLSVGNPSFTAWRSLRSREQNLNSDQIQLQLHDIMTCSWLRRINKWGHKQVTHFLEIEN